MRILPYESAAVKVRVQLWPAKLGHFHTPSHGSKRISRLYRPVSAQSATVSDADPVQSPGDSAKFAQSPGPDYPIPMLSLCIRQPMRTGIARFPDD
jgi:hypothetical protein